MNSKAVNDRYAFWCGFLRNPRSSHSLLTKLKPGLFEIARDHHFTSAGYEQGLAAVFLQGWFESTDKNSICLISSNELRELLLYLDESFVKQFLRTIESWASDDSINGKYSRLAITFFEQVWPRQKSMRTPKLTAQLFELIFSSKTLFEKLYPTIYPKLATVDNGNDLYVYRLNIENDILRDLPYEAIRVIHKVLPDDAHKWPYSMGDTLHALLNADKDMQKAPEMIELKRKWDSL